MKRKLNVNLKKITSERITKEMADAYIAGTLSNDDWSLMTPAARKVLMRYKKARRK